MHDGTILTLYGLDPDSDPSDSDLSVFDATAETPLRKG